MDFYGQSSMLQFSEFVWPLSYSVLDVFNNFLLIDPTDRSTISSDQKRFFISLSLYPLSFFTNTPFNESSFCQKLWFYNPKKTKSCKIKLLAFILKLQDIQTHKSVEQKDDIKVVKLFYYYCWKSTGPMNC